MHYIKEKQSVYSIDDLCAFLFQLCVISDAIIGFDPRYYVVSKAIMLLFFLIMIVKLLYERELYIGFTFYLPILFMIITGLSCFWADYPSAAITRFRTQIQLYVLYLFVYLLCCDNKTGLKKFLDALYISGIGMAVLALYRYGLYGLINGLKAGQRMGGAITNENIFGMVFSKAALVAYYYYIKAKGKSIGLIHILLTILFILFALSSGSKKAFLMILVGIIGINILENGITKMWKVLLTSAIAVTGLLLILRLPIFSTMNNRIMDYFAGEKDNSELVRSNMIELSMQLFHESPVIGRGLSNFGIITGLNTYSHNNMTEVLVSTGILGFIFFYLPYIPIILCEWKIGVRYRDYTYTLLLILTIIYLVFGYAMVEYYDKEYWMLLGVLVASVDMSDLYMKNKELKNA